MAVDAGLRAFMLGVYNKVALGLVAVGRPGLRDRPASSRSATCCSSERQSGRVGYTLLGMIVAFAPLACCCSPASR